MLSSHIFARNCFVLWNIHGSPTSILSVVPSSSSSSGTSSICPTNHMENGSIGSCSGLTDQENFSSSTSMTNSITVGAVQDYTWSLVDEESVSTQLVGIAPAVVWFVKTSGGLYHGCSNFGGKTVFTYPDLATALISTKRQKNMRRTLFMIQPEWPLPSSVITSSSGSTSNDPYSGSSSTTIIASNSSIENYISCSLVENYSSTSRETVFSKPRLPLQQTASMSIAAIFESEDQKNKWIRPQSRMGATMVFSRNDLGGEDAFHQHRLTIRLHVVVVELKSGKIQYFLDAQDGVVQLAPHTTFLTNITTNQDLRLKLLLSRLVNRLKMIAEENHSTKNYSSTNDFSSSRTLASSHSSTVREVSALATKDDDIKDSSSKQNRIRRKNDHTLIIFIYGRKYRKLV